MNIAVKKYRTGTASYRHAFLGINTFDNNMS